MQQQVILEKVRGIISEIVGIERDKIIPTASLREDLQADSLASVEIVMALEDCFYIEIDEDLARRLATVGDLLTAIESMLAVRGVQTA